MTLNKEDKKKLKRKYTEANPDQFTELKLKYKNLNCIPVKEFDLMEDSELEEHIINIINFSILDDSLDTFKQISRIPEPLKNFYLVYYFHSYIIQDGIEGYLNTEFVYLLNDTIKALNFFDLKDLSKLVEKIQNSKPCDLNRIENDFYRYDKDFFDLFIKNIRLRKQDFCSIRF